MSKIRLHGTSSGYTEIVPKAAAASNTLTAPSTVGEIIAKDAAGAIGITSVQATNANFSGTTRITSGISTTLRITTGISTTLQVGGVNVLNSDGVNTTGIVTAKTFVPTEGQLGNRNLIINGAMQVAQRGTSVTDDGYQTVDRFRLGYSGSDNHLTQAQHALTSSDTGPWEKGFRYSYHITNGNQTSGAGTGDKAEIRYQVEAQDMASSGWNYTSASSYITFSFWVKSSVAQNFYGYILTLDGTGQNYPFETGSLSANTWTKITKKIPGNSNIQFDNDNAEGFRILIQPFMGTASTGSVSLNAWATLVSSTRTPNQTSTWWTTDDATFEITGVQLEVGSVATPFEHRSYGDELRRCQRYFYIHSNLGANRALSDGFCWSANEVDFMYTFPVEMRTTPSIYQVTGADYFKIQGANQATYIDGNWTLQYASKFATSHYASSDASRTAGTAMHITFNNAAARLGYTAEL